MSHHYPEGRSARLPGTKCKVLLVSAKLIKVLENGLLPRVIVFTVWQAVLFLTKMLCKRAEVFAVGCQLSATPASLGQALY